jgi:hypothetical protein
MRKYQLFWVLLVLAVIVGHSGTACAQFEGTYEVAVKKQAEKKSNRWSLTDWYAQKQKNQMMDMWLAKNSHSSNYEFFIDAESVNYGQFNGATPQTVTNRNVYGTTLAAYAGVAGLRAGYEGDTESRSRWNGSLNIRLFGRALQDTHINLEYGLQGLAVAINPQSPESFQNQFGAVSLNLYLTTHLGLEGRYAKILPAQSDRQRTMEGETSTAGAFIDFGILRLFGEWRKEFLKFDGGGAADSTEFREGFGGGLRFYF